jgi:GrpB-like predicted nucleotidyltransferase (UPF0157 family)
MTNVVPIQIRLPPIDERTRFHLARRTMFRAFTDWLAQHPDEAEALTEIDDTISVLRQLHSIGGNAA